MCVEKDSIEHIKSLIFATLYNVISVYMESLNHWVVNSDKFAVVVIVLSIIFIGISVSLLHITKQLKK